MKYGHEKTRAPAPSAAPLALLAAVGGAALSSDDFGSSVERTVKLHPLWRSLGWRDVVMGEVEQYMARQAEDTGATGFDER
jgi:hypothetical protein